MTKFTDNFTLDVPEAEKPMDAPTWDEYYADDEFIFGTEPNYFLKMEGITYLNIPKGAKVLLLGAGEGRNAVYMASLGYDVTAVDQSQTACDKAEKLAKEKGVEITTVCQDLKDFKLGISAWDCILAIFCHMDPHTRDKVFRLIPSALKKGGYVIMEGYDIKQRGFKTGGPDKAPLMWSKQMLEGYFKEKLRVVRSKDHYVNLDEGKYHQGKSAVVDFVAHKSALAQ